MTARRRYQAGREIEYKATLELAQQGYLVTRAASSKGYWDVIGIRPDGVILVSCKRAQTEALAKKTLTTERKKLALLLDALPKECVEQQLWLWIDQKGWYVKEVIA